MKLTINIQREDWRDAILARKGLTVEYTGVENVEGICPLAQALNRRFPDAMARIEESGFARFSNAEWRIDQNGQEIVDWFDNRDWGIEDVPTIRERQVTFTLLADLA